MEDVLDDVAADAATFFAVVGFAGFVGRPVEDGEVVVVIEEAVFANGVVFSPAPFLPSRK